jgi:hypothetical protein
VRGLPPTVAGTARQLGIVMLDMANLAIPARVWSR